MTDPLLSVVFVTHGAWSWTQRALEAIDEHTGADHEIIVVDNASPDGTPGRIRERFPHTRLVANATNAGFGAANNQAADLARGDVLALVNTDAIVPPGWDTPLLRELGREGVGAVVPAFLETDGTLQAAGSLAAPDGSAINYGAGGDCDDPAFGFPRAIDYGAAACMLVEREAFLAIGGFDRAYDPAYFEDVDLCLRLAERGLRTMFVPEVRVPHQGFASGGAEAAIALFHRNRPVFANRWGASLARDHPPTLWPVHPLRTLAARDARASGRVLVVTAAMPACDSVMGRAIAQVLDVAPWIRLTLVTDTAFPGAWLRRGVELLGTDTLPGILASRAGHYDVIVGAGACEAQLEAHQPQALQLDNVAGLPATVKRLRLC